MRWCGALQVDLEGLRPNNSFSGLEIPAAAAGRFFNARVCAADECGLKLHDARFQPGAALAALEIPLRFQFLPVSALDEDHFVGLLVQLTTNSSEDYDIMFNLERAALNGTRSFTSAARPREHTLVHDTIIGQPGDGASMRIRVIDPAADAPKWREFKAGALLLAMQTLGDEELGGVWLLYSMDDADSSDDPDLYDSPLSLQPPTSTPVRSRISTPPLQSSAVLASSGYRSVSVASSSEQDHDVFVAQYASGMLVQHWMGTATPACTL